MNNTFFSFKRFWLLLRNDIIINYKKYLNFFIALTIIGFVYSYNKMPTKYEKRNWGVSYVNGKLTETNKFQFTRYRYDDILFTLGLLSLGLAAGSSFSSLNKKNTARAYQLIPGSTFEKFLSEYLLIIIITGGLFLIILWIDVVLARKLALMVFEGDSTYAIEQFSLSKFISNNKAVILSMIFIIHLLFTLRHFFEKNPLVKGILATAVLFFITIGIMMSISYGFFPKEFAEGRKIYLGDKLSLDGRDYYGYWLTITSVIGTLFLLPLGYYKLKEKQL